MIRFALLFFRGKMFQERISKKKYFFFEKIFLKVGLLWNFARQHTLSTKGSQEKGQIQIPKTD